MSKLEEKIKKALNEGTLEKALDQIVEKKVEEKIREKSGEETKENENAEQEDDSKKGSNISRRSFLKKLGMGAAGLGAASLIPSASALDIKDSDGLRVYSGGTEYLNANSDPVQVKNAGLSIPDGNLSLGSSLNDGAELIDISTFRSFAVRRRGSNGASANLSIESDVSGNDWQFYDNTDINGRIAEFKTGGNVKIPNGNLSVSDAAGSDFVAESGDSMSGNLTIINDSAEIHLNNPNDGIDRSLKSDGTALQFWVDDGTNQNRSLTISDTGNLNVPNGQLSEQGNRVATRMYVDDEISATKTWAAVKFLESSGGTMSGNLDMQDNSVTTNNFEITENSNTNSLDFNFTG